MRAELAVLVVVAGFALATMPIFALSPARRAVDALESSTRGKFVLGSFVRRWFYWFVRPAERVSLALGLSPLFYNLLGFAFGAVAGWCFASGRYATAGWAVLLSGVADALDGRIARARGLASPRGNFLDSTIDRFAEVAAFVGLAVAFRSSEVALAVVTAALGGSLLVSYTRARGESQGVLCTAGVMQRAERLLLIGFGAILDGGGSALLGREPGTILLAVLAVTAVGTVATAVFRTVWIARRLPQGKGDERSG